MVSILHVTVEDVSDRIRVFLKNVYLSLSPIVIINGAIIIII